VKEVNLEDFDADIQGLTIEPELMPERTLYKVTGSVLSKFLV
jgi:hypothetical protein